MSNERSDQTAKSGEESQTLRVVEGGRRELEAKLVRDVLRPNNSESQLKDVVKRLKRRPTLTLLKKTDPNE